MVNWQAGINYMIQMRKCFKIMIKFMGEIYDKFRGSVLLMID